MSIVSRNLSQSGYNRHLIALRSAYGSGSIVLALLDPPASTITVFSTGLTIVPARSCVLTLAPPRQVSTRSKDLVLPTVMNQENYFLKRSPNLRRFTVRVSLERFVLQSHWLEYLKSLAAHTGSHPLIFRRCPFALAIYPTSLNNSNCSGSALQSPR